jgi:hypothetical protein
VAWQSCGARHGAPRVAVSAQGQRPGAADPGGAFSPKFAPAWDASGRTPRSGARQTRALVTQLSRYVSRTVRGASPTHLTSPFQGASVTQTSNSGRRSPSGGPFCGVRSALPQQDLPHRAAADDALDAAEQLRLPCPAAAAFVTHPVEDDADRHVGLR